MAELRAQIPDLTLDGHDAPGRGECVGGGEARGTKRNERPGAGNACGSVERDGDGLRRRRSVNEFEIYEVFCGVVRDRVEEA